MVKNSKKIKNKIGHHFVYDFVKISGALPTLIWLRPKIIRPDGKQKIKGGFMCTANHFGFLDPIIVQCVFWNRRIYSLATKDLFRNPFLEWFFTKVHCIIVDKSNFSMSSFHEVTKRLKQGKVVSIFPEGSVRVNEREMTAFKSGSVLMAHNARAPIVPMYIVPAGKWYQRRYIVVGAPIDVRAVCGDRPSMEDINKVTEIIRQKSQDLKQYYEENYPDRVK